MPPVNCIVNDALVHAVPNVQQTVLQFVNAVQLRLMHSLLDVTPYLVIDRCYSTATDLQEWKRVLTAQEIAQCHMPGVKVHCLVERLWNRMTRCTSQATAAVTGACRGNSCRWSLPPNGQNEVREAKLWDANGHHNRSTKCGSGTRLVGNLHFDFPQVVETYFRCDGIYYIIIISLILYNFVYSLVLFPRVKKLKIG